MRYKTVAIVLIAIFTVLFMINYASDQNHDIVIEEKSHSQTRSMMDTSVTVAVVSSNESFASQVIEDAFEQISYVDTVMNNYDDTSQISTLNTQGFLDSADPELFYVINRSKYYSEVSGGAFDISIQPILDLWASKYGPGGSFQDPSPEEINETLKLVNHSTITIEGKNIHLAEDMKITLGGVAKGYAVDLAIESMINNGIESGFVNAGGDGKYIGIKPDGSLWRVGLQNPDKGEDAVAIMDIQDMAVATSGNYERYFSDAAKVSHIADPRNGYSSQNMISATVIASTSMDSDAFATAVFVLGEEKGIDMIESIDGAECMLITNDKRIVHSSGFSNYENESK